MILPRENGSGLCRDATMPRDNLVGLIETMIEGAGIPLALSQTSSDRKTPMP